jgi:hypothetical protein
MSETGKRSKREEKEFETRCVLNPAFCAEELPGTPRPARTETPRRRYRPEVRFPPNLRGEREPSEPGRRNPQRDQNVLEQRSATEAGGQMKKPRERLCALRDGLRYDL